jgi:hypothetical protein
MGTGAGEWPEQSGRLSEPIKPGCDLPSDDEELPEDERLDRLIGDSNLLYRLQLSGYAPEEWRRPSEEFGRYGYDVLVGWMFTGRIWQEVFKKTGRHPRRPDNPFDEDTIRQICADVVVNGLEAFLENVLKKKRWDPMRGASLKTYFVGQCCFQFENVLRAHYRRLKRNREDVVKELADWRSLQGTVESADSQVLRDEQNAGAFAVVSSDTAKEAFALQWLGYSEAEIAERLGQVDEKAIENMLGYQRKKAKKRRGEAG